MDSTIKSGNSGITSIPSQHTKSNELVGMQKGATRDNQFIGASVAELHEAQVQALKELEDAMEAIQGPQKSLQISIHDRTQAIVIKVMNKETGDVIREVPSEKLLDVVAKMMELNGIIIDEKV
ncbi:flagellar protein FlaG [Paenibacillus xylanilyticus]|uniref:flagellar protein FlaG n=1 Tax=Paenibacillus xylanilyticus TaxID=248903 RepID=UPI0039A1D307